MIIIQVSRYFSVVFASSFPLSTNSQYFHVYASKKLMVGKKELMGLRIECFLAPNVVQKLACLSYLCKDMSQNCGPVEWVSPQQGHGLDHFKASRCL